jgi:uncharacterized protein YaaN involved in tellurite resistance
MAIKMGNSNPSQQQGNTNVVDSTAVVLADQNTGVISLAKADETRQEFSLETAKSKYELEIRESGVIDQLTSQIDLSNTTSIIEFGKEPATKMASLADQVMSKYDSTVIDETSKLVDALLKVMKQIDIDEVKSISEMQDSKKKKGFFEKFKESAQEKLNRLVAKYQSIGAEMDKICTQLAVYEQQIKNTNKDIADMYEAAKTEYKELVAVIMAADQACKEIEEYRDQKQAEVEEGGNPDAQFEVQSLNQALSLMEQRTADLRCSEAIALQSIPTFKIQEVSNSNLARKVNSAFITTVPAFKSALVNSVIAKQQAIQMQGLMALDDATSALIRKNAENAVSQLQQTQRLASSGAIKADDIEYAWNTIMTGIQQYKDMEVEFKKVRESEAQRIEAANAKYLAELSNGSTM